FFFSSRRRHTRFSRDWSSDVCSSDLTLLAMVDASVGGKTAVDVPAGKNLVGAFHPAAAVVADPEVLQTLPVRHARSGVAEMLKRSEERRVGKEGRGRR